PDLQARELVAALGRMAGALGDVLLGRVEERHAERAGLPDELAGPASRMLGDGDHRRLERPVHRGARRAGPPRTFGGRADGHAVGDPRQRLARDGIPIASVFGHSARLAGMVEWSDNSRGAGGWASPPGAPGGDHVRSSIALRSLAIAITALVVAGC